MKIRELLKRVFIDGQVNTTPRVYPVPEQSGPDELDLVFDYIMNNCNPVGFIYIAVVLVSMFSSWVIWGLTGWSLLSWLLGIS